ncbi:MAG: hypothetical protein WBK91_08410 [Alphaproteobacteria bacterium]
MPKSERIGPIVIVSATEPGGKKRILHMVHPQRPFETVGSSVGGYRCLEVIPLEEPTYNGGKTVAVVESSPIGHLGHPVRVRHVVMESPDAIQQAFKIAGLEGSMPKIGEQPFLRRVYRHFQRVSSPMARKGQSFEPFSNH